MSAALERLRAARLHLETTFPSVDALVRGSIGLHSTDYLTPYLSARARLPALDPRDLFRRLRTGDGLVRINAFRSTVHVVHTDDLPLLLAAVGPASANARRSPGLKSLSDDAIDAGVAALADAVADGPRTTEQLKAAVPALAADLRSWLFVAMGKGVLIRADAANARTNRSRWASLPAWVPGFRPDPRPAAEARRDLLRRAVRAFGPSTVEDLAWWLPAPKGEVTRALAGAGFASITAEGRTYWFDPALAEVDAPPRSERGAWLLPYEDALLKAHLDRSWCLAPDLKPMVFAAHPSHWWPPDGVDPGPGPHRGVNASGEARPTVWWRGRVVGRWERGDDGVRFQLHAPVDAGGRAAIEAEVAAVEAFLAAIP